MSSRRPGYALDPSTGKPLLADRAERRLPRVDHLVPFLRARLGHVPELRILASPATPGHVAFLAACGPIVIPLEFDLDVMDSTVIPAILRAYEEASAFAATGGDAGGRGPAEDLLADAQANVRAGVVADDAPDHAAAIVPAEACTGV